MLKFLSAAAWLIGAGFTPSALAWGAGRLQDGMAGRIPCSYERVRDCADGRCVVEGIERYVAVLRSKASDAERLVALKYVVHLIVDVHQPLHLGLREDKGGNLAQVQAFGRGSNLHRVWDCLIHNISL